MLLGHGARRAVRAAIHAVQVHAFGLTLDQSAHGLGTFSHSSSKDVPRQCLAALDDLQSFSLEVLTKKHNPYWGIPLNEHVPLRVIDLPMPMPDAAPAKSRCELVDFQFSPASACSGTLLQEQPVTRKRNSRGVKGPT